MQTTSPEILVPGPPKIEENPEPLKLLLGVEVDPVTKQPPRPQDLALTEWDDGQGSKRYPLSEVRAGEEKKSSRKNGDSDQGSQGEKDDRSPESPKNPKRKN